MSLLIIMEFKIHVGIHVTALTPERGVPNHYTLPLSIQESFMESTKPELGMQQPENIHGPVTGECPW